MKLLTKKKWITFHPYSACICGLKIDSKVYTWKELVRIIRFKKKPLLTALIIDWHMTTLNLTALLNPTTYFIQIKPKDNIRNAYQGKMAAILVRFTRRENEIVCLQRLSPGGHSWMNNIYFQNHCLWLFSFSHIIIATLFMGFLFLLRSFLLFIMFTWSDLYACAQKQCLKSLSKYGLVNVHVLILYV